MSNEGRAQSTVASVPGFDLVRSEDDLSGKAACAAGTFPPRVIGLRKPVVLDQGQRAGLLDLVAAGRMIRRSDGYYSATTRTRVTTDIGRFLKRYSFAVAGFDNDMVPTERGRMIAKELGASDG